ncbi:uncharacterized protein [Nicotiana tomentosiformis]|uniref:uncharacterized protein n=1 Tax=Nicotiana tomentosiformis TaxID=4098 RepID=UPI00051AF9D6|nr:uncharacterized protein LOC104117074 [Nicotiana tomentosiformis]
MEEEDRLKSENIQQANLIKELEEEEQAHRDLINVYEKQYKDNAEKIAEYEKYFVELLKDKPQEGIAVKLMGSLPKIWNFTEGRLATAKECCKSVKRVLRVQEIKEHRYNERLGYKAIQAHLQLDNMSLFLALLGDIAVENMARLVFRAVLEGGKDNVRGAISRHCAFFKTIKEADAAAFQSGLFQELEETWLLGSFKDDIHMYDTVYQLCLDKIINQASVVGWFNVLDEDFVSVLGPIVDEIEKELERNRCSGGVN